MVSKSYQKIYFAIWKHSQNFERLSRITMIPAILHTRRIFYCSMARIYMGMLPVRMSYAFPNRYLGPEREVGFADACIGGLVTTRLMSCLFVPSPFSEGLLTRQHGEVGLLRTYPADASANRLANGRGEGGLFRTYST